jgi:pimeloyl-ACP methyl ester carboxylesterase
MNKKRRASLLLFITLHSALCTFFVGCGARRTPDLERIFAATRARRGKRPVVVIPGILGSRMVNRRTGEVVWPSAFRSRTDDLPLPTTPNLEADRDELAAARIVETAKFAKLAPEVYVYQRLLRALEDYGGYREGDLDNPPEGGDQDTFYVFPYDWRRDNVESARLLVRRLQALKLRLGRPDLRFNVVAHSMGGLVARYAAMYGDRDLPPEGVEPKPDWSGASLINKIFMFGTPNEGSMEAFATLLEGYSVTGGPHARVPLLDKLTREDVFTSPALFQLLPHGGHARFLDEHLRPFAVDLYDPSVWRRYGWSAAFDPDFREAYARGLTRAQETTPAGGRQTTSTGGQGATPSREQEATARGGALEELDAYFAVVLRRARRFHEALDATAPAASGATPAPVVSATAPDPSAATPVKLYAFGGDCEETLSAPVVLRDERRGRWQTLVRPRELRASDGQRFTRAQVVAAMYEPGDGRVTRASLLGVHLAGTRASAFYETALPIAYAAFACDTHSDLQNNKTLQDNALTLLINEMVS